MTTENSPVRIGVVGTGAIAQLIHIPLLVERPDAEVVALADADERRAAHLATRFGVATVTDPDTLIREAEVDAIVLCTPNHLHAPMAVTALEAGRHVLIERPLAITPEACREVVETARRVGRAAMPGLSHRFRPDVAALRAFVHSGKLGRIHAARAAWMNRALPNRRVGWRHRREMSGGGALMDLGVQAVDLLLWLLGQPRVKRLTALATRTEFSVEDAATLMMETEEGAGLSVEVSWNFFGGDDRHYARVLGDGGGGELPPLEIYSQVGGRPMEITPRAGELPPDRNRYVQAYRREHDQFLRMVRGYAEVQEADDQIHVMEIIQAAYRSIEEGREVVL